MITSTPLPNWYPLKVIEGVPLPQEQAIALVEPIITRYLNKKFESLFPDYSESPSTYKKRLITELQGKTFLRIASSLDPRLTNWLVENEGDEFSYRFKLAPIQEQVRVIQELFKNDEDAILSLTQFEMRYNLKLESTLTKVYINPDTSKTKSRSSASSRKRSSSLTSRTYCIKFYYVPDLVKERKVLVMKGYAIAPLTAYHGVIKKVFEQNLRALLQRQKERAESRRKFYEFIKGVRDHILKRLGEEIHDGGTFEMSVPGAFNEYPYFPPCAYDLYNTVKETGYLPHNLRVQLGLFLKGAGMDVETQLRFWYSHAVDNKGFTFDQFLQKAGYQIRHLYGLVGGGTDYAPQKCETIIDQGHCPFRHRDPESLKELLLDQIKGVRGNKPLSEYELRLLEDILSLAMKDKARTACARFLALLTEQHPGKPMSHPLSFLRATLRYAGKYKADLPKSPSSTSKPGSHNQGGNP